MPYIKFWGVRGSIPTPGPDTVRYGGNTPCVELKISEDKFFILDAGSGIRALGNELTKTGKAVKSHIFISHLHWDHIQGIPFFVPAYIPGNKFIFHAAPDTDKSLGEILADQMNPINFPIQMREMASKFEFEPLGEDEYVVDGIPVKTYFLNHPGYALGYRFSVNGKDVVYISDNEPYPDPVSDGDSDVVEDMNQKLVDFVKDCDILIHDSQYTPEEYVKHVQWGHSSYDFTTKIALKANVKKLVLFHYDPMHNDDFVDEIKLAAQKIAGSKLEVTAAHEGMVIELG